MGPLARTLSSLLLLAICLELTIGSFLYCQPPDITKGKHAVKKMRVSALKQRVHYKPSRAIDGLLFRHGGNAGSVRDLMKNYGRCLRANSTRMLVKKYGFHYNLTECTPSLSRDEICNDPDRVAEFYNCYFKQHNQIFHNANATDEEQMKMKTFWKCMKDAFKGFQDTVTRKR